MGWQGLVTIIRIIKDGEIIEESDSVHEIGEKLIILDKKTKYIEISLAKPKDG